MHHFYQTLAGTALALSMSMSASALELNSVAPDFSLPNIKTHTVSHLSEYRGKVIYLDFWASWCPPCRTSFPLLETLYKKQQAKGFAIVAINMDEESEAMERFLTLYPASFDVLRDPEGVWADTYGVEAMPSSFIIDKKGMIRHIHSGFSKADIVDIENKIVKLLAE